MKRKGIVAFLIILALGTGLTLLNRCSGGDMATVTIKFSNYSAISSQSSDKSDYLSISPRLPQ